MDRSLRHKLTNFAKVTFILSCVVGAISSLAGVVFMGNISDRSFGMALLFIGIVLIVSGIINRTILQLIINIYMFIEDSRDFLEIIADKE